MPVSNNKIVAPVSIANVQYILGENSSDLGTLCRSSQVNIWAKYKPVYNNGKFYTDQWDYTNNCWKTNVTNPWWHGSGNTDVGGITPMGVTVALDNPTNMANFIALYDGDLNGWTYTPPAGGALSPYRITDFACYNHAAPPPIQNCVMSPEITQSGRLYVDAMYGDSSIYPDCITLEDFNSEAFDTLYFGILVVQNGTPKLIATATTAGVPTVDRTFAGSGEILPTGTYQAYPILSSREMFTSAFTSQSVKLYTCPKCNVMTFQIVSDSDHANVTIEFSPNLSTPNSGTFTIVNNESVAITSVKYMLTNSATNPSSAASGWADWTSTTIAAGSSALKAINYSGYSYLHIMFGKNGSGEYHKHLYISAITPPSNQGQ